MNTIKQVRFIATNFYNLQGLRNVPLGLCLVFLCFWANSLHGAAGSFLVPILSLTVALILSLAIDRYYLHALGRVKRTSESIRLEWLISAVGGVLALGAFWVDVSFKLPISTLGLVFAIGLLADYIRITWLVRGRFLLYYPLGAILIAGMSILQLLGVSNWWQLFGIKNQLLGMVIVFGIFTVIAGIWGHIFLTSTLPPRVETNHDHAI